jgi:hypothetical protein
VSRLANFALPELGTAQPQLFYFIDVIFFKYIQDCLATILDRLPGSNIVFLVLIFEVVFHLEKDLWLSAIYKNITGRLPFTKIFEVYFQENKFFTEV